MVAVGTVGTLLVGVHLLLQITGRSEPGEALVVLSLNTAATIAGLYIPLLDR